MVIRKNRLPIILGAATFLLCIPFVAMQFTSSVHWSLADFVAMGILLSGTGVICEFVMRKVITTKKRIIFCGMALLAFILVWIELAVGIFGTPFAGS